MIALAALIALLHGRCISYGLFMDDHAHFKQLRECGWSLTSLTQACRLELVGGVIDIWWLPEFTLRFFRPVAFGLMKIVYTTFGWSPSAMHAVSLAWHLSATVLLATLLRRLGAAVIPSFAAAGLFAVHPAHVATVQWIACQSELMVTCFLLLSTLCYIQFRGLRGSEHAADPDDRPGSTKWLLACVGFLGLALGCRENAAAFPFVMLALEPLLARSRRRILAANILFALALAVYVIARTSCLGGVALPPRPYVVPPSAPDFLPFVWNKALYYLLGEFLAVPIVPIGGLDYIHEHSAIFYSASAALLAALFALLLAMRERRLAFFAFCWLVCFMLPVLPAFESPHHLYLPAVGWALIAMLLFRAVGPKLGESWNLRSLAALTALACVGIVFATMTYYFSFTFDTAQKVEDRVVDEVISSTASIHSGDTLYFANLPVIAHYIGPAIENRTGLHSLHAVALTWSPRILGMQSPAEMTWSDAHTMTAEIADDSYFSGAFGRLIAEACGENNPLRKTSIQRPDFTVDLPDQADGKIRKLTFSFRIPPGTEGAHLFWGSRTRWAFAVRP